MRFAIIGTMNNEDLLCYDCGHSETAHNTGTGKCQVPVQFGSGASQACGCKDFTEDDPHEDCEDHPCADCMGDMIDKAMMYEDLRRDEEMGL